MPNGHPTFWLIAGPNGVGKTTYAMRHLRAVSGSINFVNMDEIARGLSPLDPAVAQTEAARIALARAHSFIRDRATFAMETTLSGRAHLKLLEKAEAIPDRPYLGDFVPAEREDLASGPAGEATGGGIAEIRATLCALRCYAHGNHVAVADQVRGRVAQIREGAAAHVVELSRACQP